MDAAVDIMIVNLFCHERCKRINTVLTVVQQSNEHLLAYENVPVLPKEPKGSYQPFSFRIGVKNDVPLRTLHGIHEVSISVPWDCIGNRLSDDICVHKLPSTIEVALFNGAGEITYTHPLVSDVNHFKKVASLIFFLEGLAVHSNVSQSTG